MSVITDSLKLWGYLLCMLADAENREKKEIKEKKISNICLQSGEEERNVCSLWKSLAKQTLHQASIR